MTPEADAIATVQFWILEGLTPGEVWIALDKPRYLARSVTWRVLVNVVIEMAEGKSEAPQP